MDGKGFQENEYLRHSPLCMTLWNFFWQKKPKEGEHFLRYAADLEERRRSGGGREEKMLQNVASIREAGQAKSAAGVGRYQQNEKRQLKTCLPE